MWFNFMLLQLITSIIALNTLIAIIADSYDAVTNDSPKYDAVLKIDMLRQLCDLCFWNRSNNEMVNLIIVQYLNEEVQAGEAWGGRIRHMTNAIERNGF